MRSARPCTKCPGATSWAVIDGIWARLHTASQSSRAAGGHDGSGGVTWYQDGPSASNGAAHDRLATAHRRDGGAGATRHSPSRWPTRSRSAQKASSSAVVARASSRTPAASGWSATRPATTSAAGDRAPGGRRPRRGGRTADGARVRHGRRAPRGRRPSPRRRRGARGRRRRAPGRRRTARRRPPPGRRAGRGRRGRGLPPGRRGRGPRRRPARRRAGPGDGRRHPVEGGEGAVDRLGPALEVAAAGGPALVGRRVVAVVPGEVEVAEVDERVPPVDLDVVVPGPQPVLGGVEHGPVVGVGGSGGGAQAGQAGGDAGGREVLHHAVVLVEAHALAGRAHREVTERPQSLVHGPPSLRGPRPDRPVPSCDAVRVARGV